jgi:hypothetical protein
LEDLEQHFYLEEERKWTGTLQEIIAKKKTLEQKIYATNILNLAKNGNMYVFFFFFCIFGKLILKVSDNRKDIKRIVKVISESLSWGDAIMTNDIAASTYISSHMPWVC